MPAANEWLTLIASLGAFALLLAVTITSELLLIVPLPLAFKRWIVAVSGITNAFGALILIGRLSASPFNLYPTTWGPYVTAFVLWIMFMLTVGRIFGSFFGKQARIERAAAIEVTG